MVDKGNTRIKWLGAGILFAALWASASAATKIGLTVAQPLVIAEVRFAVAALLMLAITHLIFRHRLPCGIEWKQLALYGLLNITIYLGCYVVAMQTVSAGIGSLSTATNPVFISVMSVFFLNKKMTGPLILALVICSAGVVCAAWPLFRNAYVTPGGLLILFFSMLSYSVAAIYFSSRRWNDLHLFTINGWQTFLGGLFLLPLTVLFYKSDSNHFDFTFWKCVGWLAIPVSIFAVQTWLWLLKTNPVRAGLWLFLCPLFGFLYAAWLLAEPISLYTIVGVVLVITGLVISRRNVQKDEVVFD
jgi:drug/metabolite transporter (DMT)-like permease